MHSSVNDLYCHLQKLARARTMDVVYCLTGPYINNKLCFGIGMVNFRGFS